MTGNITTTIVTTATDNDNNSIGHDNHFENIDNEKQQQPPFKQVIAEHEGEDEENATMIRCPTTSSTSSPQSDDYNDNSSDTLSHNTDTLSADSCDSFCTTQQYPSSESKEELNETNCCSSPLQTHSDMTTTAITLDRIFEDNLSVELLSLFEELLPTRESYDRRMGLVRKIERLLNTEWINKDIRVHLFGSSVNDLGTSQSDVDLCITTPWNGLRNVRILAKMFKRCSMQHVVCVPRAKVPIVRLSDPESGLACDINVNNTLALQNTKMIKTYVALDPRVRPFIMIIKHWTKQRRLNDAANGGTLSTYTWTCMAINFLQMREPPILPVLHQLSKSEKINNNDNDENNDDNDVGSSFCMDVDRLQGFGNSNRESLGGLLFAFFRRYAHEFDYEEQVVSIRHGRYLTKEEKGWHVGRNKFSLCVEEPFNVSRNLGNSADQASVQGLLVEFRRACHLLAAGASLDLVFEPYVPTITMSSLRSSISSTIPSSLSTEGLPVKQQHKLLDPSNSSKRSHALSPPPPHMIHNNARRSTHPMLQSLPSPTPLPSVVLPVHPHTTTTTTTTTAIDSPLHHPHDHHRSSENIFIHSSSVTSSPSSNHHSPYLQPIPIDSPGAFRPRFNSASSSTYSPPVVPTTGSNGYQGGVRNMRHSSHPLTCCTAPAPAHGMGPPIAITIALPPPTSSSYVSTLQQPNNKKSTAMNTNNNGSDHHNRTVDSILARYSSKPPLPPQSQRPRSRNDSTDYHHHRRNSTTSSKTNNNNNNNRRRTSRQSSIDWPTISPTSSATLELSRQKQGQHQNNNRRRRWSTVKHDAPKKTMADVLKEQHRQEERVPKPSSSSPSPSNVHHHQKPPQQQKQYRSRHRSSKTSSNNGGGGSSSSGSGGRNRRKHNNSNNNNTNNNSSNGNKSRR
ncbi:hypothetical protein INT45_010677 [Circinella minor]|uniref:polynucleotide adenylyltransferase n=1 Tax=Circinella minor TaxID=1195481 RepID=A0A8H7S1F2_9FUNG|nr:hypothetical protein INT45_010677 [Circinella minor]